MIRCPHCRATNAEGAQWCSQCYAALGEAADAQPQPGTEDPAPAAPTSGPAPTGSATPTASATPAGEPASDSGLRRGEDGLEWICVACESVNPIEASSCAACGLPFTARFATAEPPPEVDWAAARTASLLAPGLGHIRAGRPATGAARLLLFGVWALGGILILTGTGATGLPVAGPLLLGAGAVHVTTQLDLRALQSGGGEILAGRTLLWLVVGVTVLVLIGAVVGLGTATSASPP